MLDRLLPPRLDNAYRGSTLALWIFGLVVALRIAQSTVVMVDTWSIAQMADGIPLTTYSAAAAQSVVGVFALTGLYRLALMAVCVVALVRYRSAVPLLLALLIAQFLAGVVLGRLHPLGRVGSPPGVVVNRVAFALIVIGFVLSLWPRRDDVRVTAERPLQRNAR